MATAKPTIDAGYVVGLHKYAISLGEERGLRMFMAEIRRFMDLKQRVNIPKEYRAITQVVRTPYLRDTGFRVAASLTKDAPILTVTPRSDDDDARRAAAIGAQWTMGQMAEMSGISNQDTVYQSALHLVRDSESVIKVVHRPDAWANFPARDENEPADAYSRRAEAHRKGGVFAPFAHRVVDRAQMVFGDGEYGDEWCIEYGEYPLPYLNRQYGPGTLEDEISPETKIGGPPSAGAFGQGDTSMSYSNNAGFGARTMKLEYFDKDTWAVVINGHMAPGFPRENPYAPFLPYLRAISYPALYPLRSLVAALDALLTMKMNWAYLSAFPVVVMEPMAGVQQMLDALPTGDSDAPPLQMNWQPGKVYFPPSGYTMKFLEPPKTGADVDSMIQELGELINIAGIPNVFRGIGGSRQPGYSINQLMAAAQLTYRQLAQALERQQENEARLLWHMVGHTLKQDVYVLGGVEDTKKWIGLKPTGEMQQLVAPVDQLGPPKVTFRPVLPTDEQSEAMIGMQLLNAPRQVRPHAVILEKYFQSENPDEEIDDIAVEKSLEMMMPEVIAEAKRIAGLLPPPGEAPPGVVGSPQGQAAPEPNDATNSGQPTIPGLTQQFQPSGAPTGTPVPTDAGGRPSGSFPGLPSGQGT